MNLLARRTAAFCIDLSLIGISAWFLEPSAAAATNPLVAWPAACLPAIGTFGGLVGRFGRTPGKHLLSLKVAHPSHPRVGVARGLAREAIRFLSLPILVLPILYLVTLANIGRTPYDQFLGLQVEKS
jgi:hypothetical protein